MNATPKANPKNRYEIDQMSDGFSAFVERYPSFNHTKILDEWRETQYNRLDANGQIYLDFTGGGLYSEMQLCDHMGLLRTRVLGNPHSANPTSLAMTDLVEGTRKYVLHYFNASPDEYIAVFTANASGAKSDGRSNNQIISASCEGRMTKNDLEKTPFILYGLIISREYGSGN